MRTTGAARSVDDLIQENESHSDANGKKAHIYEDTDTLIQGLTSQQIEVLAQKVYDLLLDEMRLEAERLGRSR